MKKLLITLMATLSLGSLSAMQPPALSSFNHHAAFVAPITTDGGHDYIILGREATGVDKGLFDAFGGKRDQTDGTHPVNTAAREFFEEAIAPLTFNMNVQQVKNYIDVSNGNTRHVFAVRDLRRGGRNVLYLTQFSPAVLRNFKNSFGQARARIRGHGFREKDAIASIRMSELKRAILTSNSNSGVSVMAQVTDLKGHRSMQRITLRAVTVKMLRGYFEQRQYVQGKDPKIRFYAS